MVLRFSNEQSRHSVFVAELKELKRRSYGVTHFSGILFTLIEESWFKGCQEYVSGLTLLCQEQMLIKSSFFFRLI